MRNRLREMSGRSWDGLSSHEGEVHALLWSEYVFRHALLIKRYFFFRHEEVGRLLCMGRKLLHVERIEEIGRIDIVEARERTAYHRESVTRHFAIDEDTVVRGEVAGEGGCLREKW